MGGLYLPNGFLWEFLCNDECLQNEHRPKGGHCFLEPRWLGQVWAWLGWFQSSSKRWKSIAYHLSLLLYILQDLRTSLSSRACLSLLTAWKILTILSLQVLLLLLHRFMGIKRSCHQFSDHVFKGALSLFCTNPFLSGFWACWRYMTSHPTVITCLIFSVTMTRVNIHGGRSA